MNPSFKFGESNLTAEPSFGSTLQMCCCNWSRYSLRRQLLAIFGSLAAVTLIAGGLMCIIFIQVLSNNLRTTLQTNFLASAQADVTQLLTNGAQLFDKKLERWTNSFPKVMATVAEDTYRVDFPFSSDLRSYYNWPGELQGASVDTRYSANVTYLHSTINVYNTTPSGVPALPLSLRQVINRTASMDYLFRPTFRGSSEFFAGYMATPERFLRYYPGVMNNSLIQRYILYDPVSDYWYEETLAHPHTVVYTSPYYDPIAKQLMITIAQTLNTPYSNNLIGAFGADLILTTLQQDIRSLRYLTGTQIVLVERDTGYVIAYTHGTVDRLMRYNEVPGLAISDNLWYQLTTQPGSLFLEGVYYYLAQNLATSGNRYMLVALVPQSQVLAVYQTVIASISQLLELQGLIVMGAFLGGCLLIAPLILFLAYRIVTPLQQLVDDSQTITKNIGGTDLFAGVNTQVQPTGVYELDVMRHNFQAMAAASQQPDNTSAVNAYYQKPVWAPVAPPPPLVDFAFDGLPSAPPS